MTLAIDIAVDCEAWNTVPDVAALVRRSIEAAMTVAGAAEPEAELSVLLCDDATITILNRDWRGQDKATNVLSFPGAPGGPPGSPRLIGDIAVAYETTRREALDEGKSLDAYLAHLLVHGFLHLGDHDHGDDAQAAAMEGLERRIMAQLGYADPYAGSEPERMPSR